jgi:hypothetical protein
MAHADDAGNVVMALYRPRPGQDEALRALIAGHVGTLRRIGLATDRPAVLLRAADGTYLEIFEWRPGAAQRAHENPEVQAIWGAMAAIADFPALGELAESKQRFPHFAPADGVTI